VTLFLAANKQLDLQMLFTQTIKVFARHWDLYELGMRSQKYFLAGLGALSLGGLLLMFWMTRKHWRRYVVLMLGAILIVRFVLVRVGMFYGVRLPQFSKFFGGIHLNWALEVAGALVIAFAALLNIVTVRKKR
jgi:hypothetical protein